MAFAREYGGSEPADCSTKHWVYCSCFEAPDASAMTKSWSLEEGTSFHQLCRYMEVGKQCTKPFSHEDWKVLVETMKQVRYEIKRAEEATREKENPPAPKVFQTVLVSLWFTGLRGRGLNVVWALWQLKRLKLGGWRLSTSPIIMHGCHWFPIREEQTALNLFSLAH